MSDPILELSKQHRKEALEAASRALAAYGIHISEKHLLEAAGECGWDDCSDTMVLRCVAAMFEILEKYR